MSKTLTETATFTANVTCPVDGDARNAASVEAGLQPLANRTKYLNAYPLRGNFNTSECTAATKNIDVTAGDVFKCPATLTANRVYTLINGSSIPAGSMKRFYRPGGADAFTLQINGGTASITFTATTPAWAEFLWDGADWHVVGYSGDNNNTVTQTNLAGS